MRHTQALMVGPEEIKKIRLKWEALGNRLLRDGLALIDMEREGEWILTVEVIFSLVPAIKDERSDWEKKVAEITYDDWAAIRKLHGKPLT